MARRAILGAALRATGLFRPEVLLLDLTHACNSRCGGCGFRDPEPGELDAARWVQLVKEGRDLGFREVMVTGGEPLLHPEIGTLLPAFAARLPVSLITNGLALAKHADLVRRSVREAFISLDGADEASYTEIRGVRGLGAVLKGVAAIRAEVATHARVTVWEQNVGSLVAIADLAQKEGFRALSFLAPDTSSQGFGARDARHLRPPRPDQRETLRAQIARLRGHPLLQQSASSLERIEALIYGSPGAPRCLAPWTAGLVLPDGRWSHCFFLQSAATTEGGLSAAIRQTRAERRALDLEQNPMCQRCVCWRG